MGERRQLHTRLRSERLIRPIASSPSLGSNGVGNCFFVMLATHSELEGPLRDPSDGQRVRKKTRSAGDDV